VRARGVAGQLEEVGAYRVQPVVVAEPRVETVERRETGGGVLEHRHGDGAVQRDHRVVGGALEQVVERHDLGPVGVAGLIVHGRDRA
jgi:hypothetical protein